jgi:hypothetical protein
MVFLAGYLICAFITMILYFAVNEEDSLFGVALCAGLFWPLTVTLTLAAIIADVLVKKLNER